MMYYIHLYKALIRINIRYLIEYRANLFNNALSSAAWTVFSLVSIYLLTQKTTVVFGMKREELWLMATLHSVMVGIFHMLFSRNFERFSDLIYKGELDTLLLKPLDSQFAVSTWRINFATLFRLFVGILTSSWVIVTYHIPVTPWSLGVGFILFFFSVATLYAIWLLVTTCIVWSPRLSNLVEVLYTLNGMARMPRKMYQETLGNVFVAFFPIALVLTVPVHAIVNQLNAMELVSLCVFALVLNGAARVFFRYSLRFYTSVNA